MQTRAEYQRARRATLASEENQNQVVASDFDTVIVPNTNQVTAVTVKNFGEKLIAPVPVPAHQNANSAHNFRARLTRTAQATSIATVAATVALATVAAVPSGAAEIEYHAEAVSIEAQALSITAYPGDLAFSREIGGASRSSARVDLSEVLGDQFEFDTDALAAAADALSAAELLLLSERRATPELTEEIQTAAEALREALNLLAAIGEGDVERALEVLTALDVLGETEVAVEAAAAEAEVVEVEVVDGVVEIAYEPMGISPLSDFVDPFTEWVPEDEAVEVAATDPMDQIDPADFLDIAHDILLNTTERLENATHELELPIPVMEPRALTSEEFVAALIAEAQADGARLHEQYGYSLAGFANGRIPENMLQNLSWAYNHMLRPDAATQLERLNEAFRLEFGVDMAITSTYRSFAGQVQSRARHGRWAATPGTSNHGWGVAVDFSGGINRFGTAQHRWMQENAPAFGWLHPQWARRGGNLPEPWHWEFWGTPDPDTGALPSVGGIR